MIATLDLAHNVRAGLARGELPPEVRQALREALGGGSVTDGSP
jgi:hypothetical protein